MHATALSVQVRFHFGLKIPIYIYPTSDNTQTSTAAFYFTVISCERLHEQIYSSIEGGAACFRRLNGTHQVGCSCK